MAGHDKLDRIDINILGHIRAMEQGSTSRN